MKDLMNVSSEDLEQWVTNGVKEAILDMLDSGDFDRSEQFFGAVETGVRDAIWNIATNATHMPCADFYDSIKEGVKEGMPND